jgi:hypothetical protein
MLISRHFSFLKKFHIHSLLAIILLWPFFARVCKFTYSSSSYKNTSWKSILLSYVLSAPPQPHTCTSNQQAVIEPSGWVSCFLRSKFFLKCSRERERERERMSSAVSEIRESHRILFRMLWDYVQYVWDKKIAARSILYTSTLYIFFYVLLW